MVTNIQRLLQHTRLGGILTAPVIYAVVVAFLLLDLLVTIYQQICFRVYGLPLVRRADHVIFDRHDRPHMNLRERLNCAYCDYAQGVISYAREIVYRTEHFWCPIKHKSNLHGQTGVYAGYMEHGDTQDFKKKLWNERDKCRACKSSCGKDARNPGEDLGQPPVGNA